MNKNEIERENRQLKLADLFFEMGMDLDLIEKVSGVDKRKILLKKEYKSNNLPLTSNNYNSNMYVEYKNSY